MQKPKLVWEEVGGYARGSVDGLIKFRIRQTSDDNLDEWVVEESKPLTAPLHIQMEFVSCAAAIAWCELLWSNC